MNPQGKRPARQGSLARTLPLLENQATKALAAASIDRREGLTRLRMLEARWQAARSRWIAVTREAFAVQPEAVALLRSLAEEALTRAGAALDLAREEQRVHDSRVRAATRRQVVLGRLGRCLSI